MLEKNTVKQKIFVFLIGFLFVFIIMEVFFRIVVQFNPERGGYDNLGDSYTVLCLGNSHTVVNGYPQYLRQIIDDHIKNKVNIVNKGIINLNSAEMLKKIDQWLSQVKPDLIILRTGEPNLWNHYHYSAYLDRENKSSLFYLAYDFLYNFRTFRFFSILFSRLALKNKPPPIFNIEKNIDDYNKARRWLQENVNVFNKPNYSQNDIVIKENIKMLEKAIEMYPKFPKSYRFLGYIYLLLGKDKEAANLFIEGIKVNPNYRDDEENRNYYKLRYIMRNTTNRVLKRSIDEFVEDFFKKYPQHQHQFSLLNDIQLIKWVRSDVREIVSKIEKKKIKLIIHNYYPIPPSWELKQHLRFWHNQVNFILSEIAKENSIPYVNIEQVFRDRWKKGEDPKKFYRKIRGNVDSHASPYGQKLSAIELLDRIKEENIIQNGKVLPDCKKRNISTF